MHTAALRHELGDQHTYDFVEGSVPCPIAPGELDFSCASIPYLGSGKSYFRDDQLRYSRCTEIESVFSADEEYFAYFDPRNAASIHTALSDLAEHLAAEGPFDAILGFSMGAQLAATYIAYQQTHPGSATLPAIKCAVFICGGQPFDYAAVSRGEVRKLDPNETGEVIGIPTANIWGSNDTLWPGSGVHLKNLCKSHNRKEFVHDGGHEVPGSSRSSRSMVPRAAQAIRDAVEAAFQP